MWGRDSRAGGEKGKGPGRVHTGKRTFEEWRISCSLRRRHLLPTASLLGGAFNVHLEDETPAVPSSEAKVPLCKSPDALAVPTAAQPRDHSHASNPMSSSPSRGLVALPATQPHPDRTTEMRSSSSFFFFFKSPFKQQKCLASCCQESCHHGKEKERVPQISAESLPRTVNIFGSPQRTNAFLSLAGSAVLKRLTPG